MGGGGGGGVKEVVREHQYEPNTGLADTRSGESDQEAGLQITNCGWNRNLQFQ